MMNLYQNRCAVAFCLLLAAPHLQGQGSEESVEHYSEVGNRALADGRYADAEQAFVRLNDLAPGIAEVHANLGLVYFEERKFPDAVQELQRAVKLKPALTKSGTLLAISLSELGRYQEALPGLEKGFHRSTDSETRRLCGLHLERAYTGLQQHSKAVEVALELDKLFPEDPEVLYHGGRVYGNFAYLTMNRLAKVAPNSSWRHQAMAEALESQGSAIAIGEYREVLRLDPHRPGIHYRLGRALLAQAEKANSIDTDNFTEAVKEFQAELDVDPTNANAAYEIGEIHRKAGELDQAQQFFERALKSYPGFGEAHLGLAAVLMEKREPAQALPHIQQAIAIDSENQVAWFRLARVQRALGNTAEQQKATAEFQRLRHKFNQQMLIDPVFSPSDVTRQEVGPGAGPDQ